MNRIFFPYNKVKIMNLRKAERSEPSHRLSSVIILDMGKGDRGFCGTMEHKRTMEEGLRTQAVWSLPYKQNDMS